MCSSDLASAHSCRSPFDRSLVVPVEQGNGDRELIDADPGSPEIAVDRRNRSDRAKALMHRGTSRAPGSPFVSIEKDPIAGPIR